MTPIPHETAQRLRHAFSRIQSDIYAADDIPETTKWRMIEGISADAFRLVDDLEGVIR